jgi:hypothetical protein
MSSVDRRQFLKRAGVAGAGAGAVWVAPSVLELDAAWAAPSGPCATLPSLTMVTPGTSASPASNNGWIYSATGMGGGGGLGVENGWYGQSTRFVVEANPNQPVTSALVTYTHPLGALAGGRTYRFSYQTYARTINQYPQVLTVQIVNTTTGAVVANVGTYATKTGVTGATLLADSTNQSQTGTNWTVPAGGGSYSLQYQFTFLDAASGNLVADDIGDTAPFTFCTKGLPGRRRPGSP